MNSNENLTEKDIQKLKDQLISKRHQLLEDMGELENESMRKSAKSNETGDLSATPTHMADAGTDAFRQEMELGRIDRERGLIEEIDGALERIENNNYGFCLRDGKPIAKERLEVLPWTRLCVECEELREKQP